MSTNLPRFVMPNGQEITLKGQMTLGRSVETDIRLDDTIASRKHAVIDVVGEQVTLTDLNSSNGTHVNELKIGASVTLHDGDRVRIGNVTLVFKSAVASSAETNKVASPMEQPLQDGTVVWQSGAAPMTLVRGDGSEFGLNRSVRIGRSKDNDIDLLEDTSASHFHCKIDVIAGQAVISDLSSSNGTWVNGKKISKPVTLKHGDKILVGDSVLRLRVGEQPLVIEDKTKSSPLGCGLLVGSSLIAVIGVGAIAIALVVVGVIMLSPTPTPSVVTVNTSGSATQQAANEQKALRALVQVIVPVGDPKTTKQSSTGSGSIISNKGHVITNFHVIGDKKTGKSYNNEGWAAIAINWNNPSDAPDTLYICDVIKTSATLDLALLKPRSLLKNGQAQALPADLVFPFLPVGNSDAMKIGDPIAVLGFPGLGGDTPTFTRGTISGYLVDDDNGIDKGWFKTDAEINPGNSGGMAINSNGELIGVPTLVTFNKPSQATGKIGEIRPINFAAEFVNAAR
ncbi:MAG: FHA domain-containing protein [Chloroflexi bacterium]|nr:FHA domain-containing protein [Chloroflexota bacterium]MBI5082701.1 FHA domain-containing protein [Chloroflexota bacterium]